MINRLLLALLLVAAVGVLNFFLVRLAPGDPAVTLAGLAGGATEETLAQIRAAWGLDKPLWQQFLIYFGNVLSGDLGTSYFFNRPVADIILERVGPTLLLVLSSLLVSVGGGTLLGVLSARNPNGWLSNAVTLFSLSGYAMPTFWLGQLLLITLAWYFPVFPVGGMASFGTEGWLARTLEVAHHLVLPAFALGVTFLAQYSRVSRASMLEVLGSDYIRTARAKGVGEASLIFKHALRNAVLPVVTLAGLQLGQILSGAVLIEVVFQWPGLGSLAFDSILRRDYPTILGILLCSAAMVVTINLLTDLCYRLVDPRISFGGKA